MPKINQAQKLKYLIKFKKAKVAVIGLGYVGLPMSVEAAKAGFKVWGIDKSRDRVGRLNRGVSYIGDVSSEVLGPLVKQKRIEAFSHFTLLEKADAILICVPTPLDKYKIPDMSYIDSAAREVAKRLRRGQLIILKSTTWPGTTEEFLLPKLEERGLKIGEDFFLAFAPERIEPGNKNYTVTNTPKVIGGVTKNCTTLTVQFFRTFINEVHPVSSPRAAEMTKLLENVYRLVNISLVNELTQLAERMRIDIWEVIEAAKTKPYGFSAFYPSAKCGGHCIPEDPHYLSWKARAHGFSTRFIDLAGEINEGMPQYTISRLIQLLNSQGKSIRGAKIFILGVAFKKDVEDTRESAAYPVIRDLLGREALVSIHDPHVEGFEVDETSFESEDLTPQNLRKADCVIVLTNHSAIDFDMVATHAKLVFDTRNAFGGRSLKNVVRL